MKKLGLIVVQAAFGIFALAGLVHIFATDDPVGYFRDSPSRLFWVATIATAGGLVTWAFCKLPPRAQRYASTLGFGAVAGVATAAIGFFVFAFFSLASDVVKEGGSFWDPLPMFLPVVFLLPPVAAFYWIACWRVWRKGATR